MVTRRHGVNHGGRRPAVVAARGPGLVDASRQSFTSPCFPEFSGFPNFALTIEIRLPRRPEGVDQYIPRSPVIRRTAIPTLSRPSSKYAAAAGFHNSSIRAGSDEIEALPRRATQVLLRLSLI